MRCMTCISQQKCENIFGCKVYIVEKRKDGRINESISDSGRRYSIYRNKHWFDKSVISEIVFNTSMTGYLEVLTDPSYAGQAVVMTYPLIGNYGVTPDMESAQPWPDGYIVRELSRIPSNFRCQGTIQDFLKEHDIPGIGETRRKALMRKFKSLENIRDASLEELTETESMNAGSAQQVYDFFHVSNCK